MRPFLAGSHPLATRPSPISRRSRRTRAGRGVHLSTARGGARQMPPTADAFVTDRSHGPPEPAGKSAHCRPADRDRGRAAGTGPSFTPTHDRTDVRSGHRGLQRTAAATRSLAAQRRACLRHATATPGDRPIEEPRTKSGDRCAERPRNSSAAPDDPNVLARTNDKFAHLHNPSDDQQRPQLTGFATPLYGCLGTRTPASHYTQSAAEFSR